MFINPLAQLPAGQQMFGNPSLPPIQHPIMKKDEPGGLKRYLNFIADYTGCGHWRMLWPEQVLNSYRQCVIQSSTVMVTDPKYFHGVKCVRVQRQATESQHQYLKFLKEKVGVRLIYEIDDICFGEDIPEYNAFRGAFVGDKVRAGVQSMMEYCDEMTVTNMEMKNYYLNKTSQTNISIIPNYPPRMWLGRLYDHKKISQLYDKHRKKPRVLYAGSSSHFDLHVRNNNVDDITHVVESIINTVDKYQWVFMGGYPAQLKPFVESGKIEYHKWTHLMDYPVTVKNLKINAMIAPLADNIFNRCKSDIKFLEAASLGIPILCQDLPTYKLCNTKFSTGIQMLTGLQHLFSDKKHYTRTSEKNLKIVENMWLENEPNRNKYLELYAYEYGNPERKELNKINDSKKD